MERQRKSENVSLEAKLEPSKKKIAAVDTGSNVAYSLIVGGLLDYSAGLNLSGIVASRASATVMNTITGGPYGWWRERVFRASNTTENSGRIRRTVAELAAFNSFQVPIYAIAVALGSFVSEGEVNMEKVQNGASYLSTVSPFIGPTLGWFTDLSRRAFRINSAARGAYNG